MPFSRLKKYLNTYPQINYEKLMDQVVSSKYVSFDIFDTLLKRDVKHVEDVFSFVEKKWNENNPNQKIENFVNLRINAEQKAYKKYGMNTKLENIYEFLSVDLAVLDLEIKTEHALNIANQPFLEVFKELINLKKTIILISDMYLPKKEIKKMLENAGFIGYQNLYVSCEYGKDKISGELFDLVIKQEKIDRKKLIHIGDSWKADWYGAKKVGIKTYHIPKNMINIRSYNKSKTIVNNTLDSFTNNRIEKYEYDKYQKFGYQVFGPVLLGFIQWLNKEVDQNKNMYFLARDGYIVKLAYEMLFTDEDDSGQYLYGSRRAFKVPLLQYTSSLTQIAELINLPSTYTADELLVALGLDNHQIEHDLGNQIFTEFYFEKIPVLKSLVENNLSLIKKNSEIESHSLLKYLEQVNFKNEVSIVDIGWRGSMQAYLEEFAKKNEINININGFYVGLSDEAKEFKINAKGYWFDMLNDEDAVDLATPFKGLLEFLFSANHGTTLKFEIQSDMVKPILAFYEYSGEHNLIIQGELLNSIRQAALQFIKDFKNSGLNGNLIIDAKSGFNNLQTIGLKPVLKDVNYLGDFVFVDQNVNALAKPQSFGYYICHPQKFKYDLLASRWKVGFMKRFMKLPFNYYYIYKKIK